MSDIGRTLPGVEHTADPWKNSMFSSPLKMKDRINRTLDFGGWFESGMVTNFNSEDSNNLVSTNAASREHDRLGVEIMGNVPGSGSRILMYRKTGLDWPVGCGQSSFLSGNDSGTVSS